MNHGELIVHTICTIINYEKSMKRMVNSSEEKGEISR